MDVLRELVRRAQLYVVDGGGSVPRLVGLVADADDEKDEDSTALAPPALSESETTRRRDDLLCTSAAAASVCAAEEDLACARAEVSDFRAQLKVSLKERDRLAAREAARRVDVMTLGLSCTAPTHLQFASQRCQALVRAYETRGGVLIDRMREARGGAEEGEGTPVHSAAANRRE